MFIFLIEYPKFCLEKTRIILAFAFERERERERERESPLSAFGI